MFKKCIDVHQNLYGTAILATYASLIITFVTQIQHLYTSELHYTLKVSAQTELTCHKSFVQRVKSSEKSTKSQDRLEATNATKFK